MSAIVYPEEWSARPVYTLDFLGRVRFTFQEWSLCEGARNPGWDVVDGFVRSAIQANKVSVIEVFEPAPGANRYSSSTRLSGDELRASAQVCVRRAMQRDAFVMLLLHESLDMRDVLGEYVLSAEGQLGHDDEERVFGACLEGFRAALEEGRRALVVSHDGDPLFLIHLQELE